MVPVIMAVGAAVAAVAGLIGNLVANGQRAEAEAVRRRAMEQYNIQLPDIDAIHAQEVKGNAFDEIQGDPRLREAQLGALSEVEDIAAAGGLRQQDKARIAEIRSASNQQERGAREALVQSANARGLGGSSSELQALLANQQGAAERASQQGMDVSAQAEMAALDAIEQQAQMSGAIRGQDYAQAADRAAAENSIQQFNAGQRQGADVFNAGQQHQRFADQLSLADRRAQAMGRQADSIEGRADQTQQTASGIGQGLNQAAGSVAQYQAYQDWLRSQQQPTVPTGGGGTPYYVRRP